MKNIPTFEQFLNESKDVPLTMNDVKKYKSKHIQNTVKWLLEKLENYEGVNLYEMFVVTRSEVTTAEFRAWHKKSMSWVSVTIRDKGNAATYNVINSYESFRPSAGPKLEREKSLDEDRLKMDFGMGLMATNIRKFRKKEEWQLRHLKTEGLDTVAITSMELDNGLNDLEAISQYLKKNGVKHKIDGQGQLKVDKKEYDIVRSYLKSERYIKESSEIGGYYLMSTLRDLADDSKRIRDTKMYDAYMWLHDRIEQSYRDIDLNRDDIRDLLKEPQGRKHAKNLPDWAIEDLFSESVNEAIQDWRNPGYPSSDEFNRLVKQAKSRYSKSYDMEISDDTISLSIGSHDIVIVDSPSSKTIHAELAADRLPKGVVSSKSHDYKDIDKIFKVIDMWLSKYTWLNESLNEDSKVEGRIKELAEDPKIQDAMGSSNVADLEHAFMVLFKRGYGAAKTNWGAVHPTIKKLGKGDAAYNAWGHSRLNAFIEKREAYKTSDSDVADWLKGKGEKPEPK